MDSHRDQSFDDPASQAAASAEYRVIASYRDYTQAQGTVDYLSDADFPPVENLRIVGHGVSTVEAITGRMTLHAPPSPVRPAAHGGGACSSACCWECSPPAPHG